MQPAAQLVGAGGGPSGASRPRPQAFAWILAAVGIFALAIIAIIAVVVLRSSPSFDAGRITSGHTTTFDVAEDRTWELSVELAAGWVLIDVRGDGEFDAVAMLVDARTGEQIAFNDDRGGDLAARHGGDRLDPLIEAQLPAGRYTLVVHGWAGRAGSGFVRFVEVGG